MPVSLVVLILRALFIVVHSDEFGVQKHSLEFFPEGVMKLLVWPSQTETALPSSGETPVVICVAMPLNWLGTIVFW